MDARKGNIYEILNGNKQFLIPVYQRFYSWDIDQCKRLWNDIVEMQRKDKVGHFVGSIVNIAEQAMPTGVQKYMIIDGQQRMTTLTLLLLALRDYAIMNPSDTTINARRIDNMLLKNEYESGDERYKLLLTETDRDVLISLVEEKPIAEGSRSRLIENYNFFAHKLADKEIQPAEVYESIGKLQIVNITLDRAVDDAQAIFESLNSTGKELSESDLIRNYVLMGLEPSEQTYVYEHLWRPIYATALDYDRTAKTTKQFFTKVQNKMHYAVHGHTAAELIYERADADKPHMGLTTWAAAPEGKIIKSDVSVAKNYLSEKEMRSLERIVSAYLDLAEDRAERHIPMTMEDWAKRLDLFLMTDDRDVLQDAGKITAEIAKAKAETEFEKYRVIQDRLFMSDFDKYMLELEEKTKRPCV